MIAPTSWMDWTVGAGALATVSVLALMGYRALFEPEREPVKIEESQEERLSDPRRAA